MVHEIRCAAVNELGALDKVLIKARPSTQNALSERPR